jgi:tetratricopeptide (TPR) repeat protein
MAAEERLLQRDLGIVMRHGLGGIALRHGLGALAMLSWSLAGCSAPPETGRIAREEDARLADAALMAGDYARAAPLYRRALTKAPDELALHYGLAVAASHLDQKAEAIREFSWVLEHSEPSRPEADNARRWLTSVGALPRGAKLHSPPGATGEPSAAATARVEGRVAPPDARQAGPVKRMQLFLIEQPSRVHHYPVRTDEDGRFRFPTVAPGTYKLSDRMTGPPTWRLRVEAKLGQVVFVELGPDNTTKSRDDFPDHH